LFLRLEDEEVLVLDCRDVSDWERYGHHIPGSLWMTYEELLRDWQVLPDDELIVVCGVAPDGSDARRASHLLRQRGLAAVCLDGGLQGWITNGLPTECHETVATFGGVL
jgi:rhodanese-related sulfurtransferase